MSAEFIPLKGKQLALVEKLEAEIKRLRADNHKLMLWNEELQAKLDRALAMAEKLRK